MSVEIRRMTSDEFEIFYQWSVEHQAKELMEELQMSHEKAINETIAEIAQMLPDGFHTEQNDLMTIVAEDENVGFIWTIYEETESNVLYVILPFGNRNAVKDMGKQPYIWQKRTLW